MKVFRSSFQHRGEDYVLVSRPLGRPVAFECLTAAELAVAEGILAGRSMRELAMQRKVSERTVANQTAQIYRKLGVGSRQELVRLAAPPFRVDVV
jgi:DNA-binding NarL/FixJ family response regulator